MTSIKLSDLQLDILRVLWTRETASTSEVHQAHAGSRDLAYTTVATLLKRLEDKGAIGHKPNGRQYVYFPKVEESEVRSGMVINLLDRLFRGDPAALVNHVLGDERLDPADLQRIEALINDRGGKDGK